MFIRVKLRIWKLLQQWVGRKYTDQNELNAKLLSKWTKRLLAKSSADIIMVGAGEPETFAYLDTSIPIVYLADSTFHLKLDYYPWHTGLSKRFIVQGEEIERRALQRSAHICYSSFWARRSAMENYGISLDKISVHPMGPNLDTVPGSLHKINDYEVLNLLFIGINWKRKGGDIAYKTYLQLKGVLPCSLTIVGCQPEVDLGEDVKIIPYLDKDNDRDHEIYMDLLMRSHLLLLPTFADCTPIVFSEAAAFGLPVITRQTGGTNDVVIDGVTGYCLPYEATESVFARCIHDLWNDKPGYEKMREASRSHYETQLNWDAWCHHMNGIICSLLVYEKEDIDY